MTCDALKQFESEGHTIGDFAVVHEETACMAFLADHAADWDVIIFSGFGYESCSLQVGQFQETKFVLIDAAPMGAPENLLSVVFSESEVSYTAGYLAGLVTESRIVAVAGGYPFPAVQRFVNGFQLGVRASCPDCKIIGKFLNTFDGAGGADFGTAVVAEGADVVYGAGGFTGTMTILTAAELGAHVIGVDVDERHWTFGSASVAAQQKVMTSTAKQVDRGALLGARLWLEGHELPADNTLLLDYANGGVSLAPCHDACAVAGQFLANEVAAIEQGLRLRTVTVPVFVWAVPALPGDAKANTWYPVDNFADQPSPRVQFAATSMGDPFGLKRFILAFGGQSLTGTKNNEMWHYDLTSLHWVKLLSNGAAPPPTAESCMVTIGDNGWGAQVHVFGGMTDTGLTEKLYTWNPTPPFGPPAETWAEVTAATSPSARAGPSCVLLPGGESFAAFGGRRELSFEHDLWVFTRGAGWEEVRGDGPAARKGAGIAVGAFNGGGEALAIVAGQSAQGGLQDAWVRALPLADSAWVQLKSLPVGLSFTPLVAFEAGTLVVWPMEEINVFTLEGRTYDKGHYAFVYSHSTDSWSPQAHLGPSRQLAVGLRVPTGFPMFTDLWSLGGQDEDGLASAVMGATYMRKPICAAGQTFHAEEGQCVNCTIGTYSHEGHEGECLACLPGQYSDVAGSAVCNLCDQGYAQPSKGATECEVCPAGTFTDAVGQTSCQACSAGQFSTAGSAACDPCPLGTYREHDGAPECVACEGEGETSFTTLVRGARSAAECTCPPSRFWNRRDDRCDACPRGAFCPGGLHLPVAFEGNYGKFVGSVDKYAEEEAQKLSGTFEKAPTLFHTMEVYKCADKTSRCPGTTLTWAMDTYQVEDVTKQHVVVGSPLLGSCPQNADPLADRTGIACDRCQDGFYGTGKECMKCSDDAQAGNVVLMLLVPIMMICLYRGTTSSGSQRVQAAFILVSTCGMFAFFMQIVAVFSTFAVSWPEELGWLFEMSAVFMFDLNGFSASCFHGTGFGGKYWASILVPLFVILASGLGYALTKVLPVPDLWKMLPNPTFSMLGMLLSALYITLVKVVVAFWECAENPAAERTLAKYKDVVCSSDEHMEVAPAMALGLIFYVFGFYVAFLRSAYIAPAQWANVGFRERWKFMLTRWRPDTYFWGSCVMTRNLLVAFAGLISDEPRVQLVYVVCVVVLAFTMTAVYQPWRAIVLNHYDVASSSVLTFVGVFGIIFVSLDAEIEVLQQNDLATQDKEAEQRTFAAVLSGLVAVFLALFLALGMWCMTLALPKQVDKAIEASKAECKELTALLLEKVGSSTFSEKAAALIEESTPYDRRGLKNFLVKIGADQGSHVSGITDTLSIEKAKAMTGASDSAPALVSA